MIAAEIGIHEPTRRGRVLLTPISAKANRYSHRFGAANQRLRDILGSDWTDAVIIRNSQINALSAKVQADFEQEMVSHLFTFSPKHCEVIKESGTRLVIRHGLERAALYGFTQRGPVRLFIELMFMFGSEFATDPQHRWVLPGFVEHMPGDQMQRAHLLLRLANEYLAAVSGPNHQFAAASLRRTRMQLQLAEHRTVNLSLEKLREALPAALRDVYPEKAVYLGDEGLSQVVRQGFLLASEQKFVEARSFALLVFLVFALGHGAASDPLYPWVQHALADKLIPSPDARAARLESKAEVYLDHVIEYVREM